MVLKAGADVAGDVVGHGSADGAVVAAAKVPQDAVMHVRLSEAEQVAMDARWRAEGFKNRSSYVRHLVRLDVGAPSTNPAILGEIEDAAAAFGAAGRNLNQVTRAINEQRKAGAVFNPHDLVEQDDLLALKASFDGMRKAISKAVKSVRARTVGS
jgi:Arc/MetJ-type ribon-helix-helix transcriptional regulator